MPHTAVITETGATDIVHEDPDHEGCDFDAYLASNWATSPSFLVGPWAFTWQAGYWNGSPITT
jgi:hypothetical protein